MAKKRSAVTPTSQTNGSSDSSSLSQADVLAQQMARRSLERWGDRCYIGGRDRVRLFCLKAKLAQQILFQLEGVPLGRFIVIVGLPSSCKSALGYDFCRLFRQAQGSFCLIETEFKDSDSLRYSIVGQSTKRAEFLQAYTTEDWQAMIEHGTETARNLMDKDDPPRSKPKIWLLDSVSGVTTAKNLEAIDQQGFAGLTQPQNANIINTYSKGMPGWIANYPMTIMAVNHLKHGKDRFDNTTRKLQGGEAIRFHESIEIECRAVGGQKERQLPARETFRRIALRIQKNSLAQQSPELEVEMCWWVEPSNPKDPSSRLIQKTIWDWETAAVEYLLTTDFPAKVRRQIEDAVDLNKVTKRQQTYIWSEALGIPEDEPVSMRLAGHLLEKRVDIKEKLYGPLGIQRAFLFQPGRDIEEQRREALDSLYVSDEDGLSEDFCPWQTRFSGGASPQAISPTESEVTDETSEDV